MTTARKARDTRGKQRPLHCGHIPTGTVAWPLHRPDISEARASVYSCRGEECVRDAAAWVQEYTGRLGVYCDFTPGGAR